MKIGIITFHWATNYGAVLQAYALQSFLKKLKHDVKIIDYMPDYYDKSFRNCFRAKRPRIIIKNILEYYKEKPFVIFRKKYFDLTARYNSIQELKTMPPDCDVYICGSDQIWNQYFTTLGEGQITTSYFLDFGDQKTIRISYAASFGCTEYPEAIEKIAAPCLSKFKAISVRERTGCEIIRRMGFNKVSLMPDPTLLLSAKDYDKIIDHPVIDDDAFSFFYVIHDHQFTVKKIEDFFRSKLSKRVVSTKRLRYSMIDINEWLANIKSCEYIVTNSFHGVVFSIIYNKPFIAIPVEGTLAGMNDRIFTLLNQLGLQNRILANCDLNRMMALLSEKINWDCVDEKIQSLRNDAENFLLENIRSDFFENISFEQKELTGVMV